MIPLSCRRFRFCIALYIVELSAFKIKETQKPAAPDGAFPVAVGNGLRLQLKSASAIAFALDRMAPVEDSAG